MEEKRFLELLSNKKIISLSMENVTYRGARNTAFTWSISYHRISNDVSIYRSISSCFTTRKDCARHSNRKSGFVSLWRMRWTKSWSTRRHCHRVSERGGKKNGKLSSHAKHHTFDIDNGSLRTFLDTRLLCPRINHDYSRYIPSWPRFLATALARKLTLKKNFYF